MFNDLDNNVFFIKFVLVSSKMEYFIILNITSVKQHKILSQIHSLINFSQRKLVAFM